MNRAFEVWETKLSSQPEEKETLKQIRDSYRGGRLIPFVGAGLSMCVKDFPSWNDLLAQLRDDLEEKDRKSFDQLDRDPLEKAEFFSRKRGKQMLGTKVRELLNGRENALLSTRHGGHLLLPCQDLLCKRFGRIYTTNYDHLLELACTAPGHDAVPVFDAKSAEQKRREWCKEYPVSGQLWTKANLPPVRRIVHVVKFHGDYMKPEDIVITESDYYRRLLDVDAKDILLMGDLLGRDILFIGYRFGDISIKYVFHQLARLMDEIEREYPDRRRPGRLFFVTTEEDKARAEYLRMSYGVSSLCIQSLCQNVPPVSGVRYAPKDDGKDKSRWNRGKPVFVKSKDLFNMANVEPTQTPPVANEKEFDRLYETAKSVFRLNDRKLTAREKSRLTALAESNAFTTLRATATQACYENFLRAVFRR
jgi:hypothetical protein